MYVIITDWRRLIPRALYEWKARKYYHSKTRKIQRIGSCWRRNDRNKIIKHLSTVRRGRLYVSRQNMKRFFKAWVQFVRMFNRLLIQFTRNLAKLYDSRHCRVFISPHRRKWWINRSVSFYDVLWSNRNYNNRNTAAIIIAITKNAILRSIDEWTRRILSLKRIKQASLVLCRKMQGGASSHGRSVDDDEDDDSNGANRVEDNTRCAMYLCLLNKRVNCDDRDDADTIREMQKIKRG